MYIKGKFTIHNIFLFFILLICLNLHYVGGLSPPRVPQGMLNPTVFFQSILGEISQGIYLEKCMVWVDDIISWGNTQAEVVENLRQGWRYCSIHGLPQVPFLHNDYEVVWLDYSS